MSYIDAHFNLNRFCGVCGARDTIQCEPLVLTATCQKCPNYHDVCEPCKKRLGLELLHQSWAYDDGTIGTCVDWLTCPDAAAVADVLMAEDE